jgi:hypothetical protein
MEIEGNKKSFFPPSERERVRGVWQKGNIFLLNQKVGIGSEERAKKLKKFNWIFHFVDLLALSLFTFHKLVSR